MRIVSLVPSHTESLLELGADVVGRTRFCIHPDAARNIPHVGGTKDASLEKILAVSPDLVVADKDENPKALVDALQEAGIEVLWSSIDTVEDAAAFLETLGRRLGTKAAAQAAAQAAAIRAEGRPTRRIPVFCPIWHPWMTFDRTAYPHAMLEAAGLHNVFADHEGPKYFEVTDEEVAATEAVITLLPTEPFPFHKKAVDTSGLGAAARSIVIDGEALTWFGTRTLHGLRELRRVAGTIGGEGSR